MNLFSLVAIIVLGLFTLVSGTAGWRLVIQLSVLAATCFVLIWSRTGGNVRHAGGGLVAVMAVLSLYLVIAGGFDRTGPLWTLLFPPLAFYLLGYRAGTLAVGATVIAFAAVLYVPNDALAVTRYEATFQIRFLLAYVLCAGIAFIYEYSRERAQLELIATADKLDRYARTDVLTGLSNRRDMLDQLSREQYRFERTGRPYAVLICDIDHFKRINDSLGHPCGDEVLVGIADLLSSRVKRQDWVCRWGGEEFLILLTDTTVREARTVADRIRQAVSEHTFRCHAGGDLSVTISVGYVGSEQGLATSHLIHQADVGLYQAKRSGRNRVHSALGADSP